MSEQEQFEQWFENDTKGLDKASARAGWVERMAQESAELAQLREERDGILAARNAYASEFSPDVNGDPDTGSVHANIRALKAERDELRAKLAAYEDQRLTPAQTEQKPVLMVRTKGSHMWEQIDAESFEFCQQDSDYECREFYAGRTEQAATVPDGWKLVPVEPTEEMIASAIYAHNRAVEDQYNPTPTQAYYGHEQWEYGFRAMLEAAPPAPAEADRRVEALAAKLYPLLNQWKPTTNKAMEAKSAVRVVLSEALAKGEGND